MRISIDTGELHTLAGVYRREADDLNRTASTLRAHNGTALNRHDPAIRAADVPRRVAGLAQRSDQIANDLRVDATNFDRIARTMEDDQGGGLLTHPDGPASTMPIAWLRPIGKLGWIRPLPTWADGEGRAARPISLAHRPEDRFVNGLRDALRRFQRRATNTWAAGKHATTSIFGRVRDLTRSVAGAIHHFGKRVAHFTAAAWTRGRDFAARTYRTVTDGIRRCISATAQAFQSALHTITTTGKFVADTATFTWDLIKSLPGHAIDAFKKLHEALVELPGWRLLQLLSVPVIGPMGWILVGAMKSIFAPVHLEPYDGLDGHKPPTDAFDEKSLHHLEPAQSTSDYMAKLNDLKPGMIEVIRVEGPPPSYVVLLKGIDGIVDPRDWNSPNNSDALNVLLERYGVNSPWGRAVQEAMARSIPPGPPPRPKVMLMCHSGGGIVASNLLHSDAFKGLYDVTDVVIAGSGVPDHLPGIDKSTNVVMLQHATDVVANVSFTGGMASHPKGHEPIPPNHQFVVFDSHPTNDYDLGKDYKSGHHPWYYQQEMDNTNSPSAQLIKGMDKRYANKGPVSSKFYRMSD